MTLCSSCDSKRMRGNHTLVQCSALPSLEFSIMVPTDEAVAVALAVSLRPGVEARFPIWSFPSWFPVMKLSL